MNERKELDELMKLAGKAYNEEKYEEAFELYEKAAEQGTPKAQFFLGQLYEFGEEIKQDCKKAFEWYKKSAEQDDNDAQFKIAYMYTNGLWGKQDYKKTIEWYLKSAEQGNNVAQYNLGVMYENGQGVEQNYEKAVEWYLKAAEQGDADAQYNLGVMYENGRGIEQNYEKAFEWYLKAAEQGDVRAQNNLGVMYEYGKGVEQNYKKTVEWYQKAAEQGNAVAQNNLGIMYYDGDGVEQNYEKAFEWYQKAAEQGNASAQYNLGEQYFCGRGIGKDDSIAFYWWKKASQQEEAWSEICLSCMYKNGDYVKQNPEKAKKLWDKAKDLCDNQTVNYLIDMYYKNRTENKDNEKKSMLAEKSPTNTENNGYKIKNVQIVSGKSLNPYWKTNMQVVSTDKGDFIDNLPGISHGSTPLGHDWKQEIGKTVSVVTSKDSKSNNTWIFISNEFEKFQSKSFVTEKEELPPDYDINENPELKQTYEFIKQGVPVIFLTGGAGTGKSTFIKYIKNNLKSDMNKNYVILAPTGVAAINVGGQTIHSFFKWHTDVFEDKDVTDKQPKNPIIDHTDLIIIDEISMVHSWMIDHIDYALRLWCDKNKPFGGKQLLLIGDCFQLPPVKNEDDSDKKKYYEQWTSPFFFAAKAFEKISKDKIKALQLKKIYRQASDRHFIHILNRIRECKSGYERDIDYLNKNCFIETRLGTKNVPLESLLLCTTNANAEEFNNKRMFNLQRKGEKSITFKAFIQDDFKTDSVLTPVSLELCIGAKIMVTKNINSEHLVNGDMGKVLGFGGTGNSQNDYVDIDVKGIRHHITRETWESLRYEWNESTKTIAQKIVGSFNQIPLKLGWAVTIHKSQGLTLDSVAIDAPDAWDSGQVYVALSRAKSLNGVLLCQKLPVSAVKVDKYVQAKYKELFPENEDIVTDFEEDYSSKLSNDAFTIDRTEEITSVKIGGITFELYPKNPMEKSAIQNHVKRTMAVLLIENLIPEAEMKRLLSDKNYCYSTFGIVGNTSAKIKYTLLSKNKNDFYDSYYDQYKCWKDDYGGYYICSQWYQNCKAKFAKWLINLSQGNLYGYVVATDDSYTDESVDWAKKKQEEKDRNIAAFLKEEKEMEEKLKKNKS